MEPSVGRSGRTEKADRRRRRAVPQPITPITTSKCASRTSPKLRDPNPSVVIIPGLGLFSFGKNKKEARITSEFFINAIHVMAARRAQDGGAPPKMLPQAKHAGQSENFKSLYNYVALPLLEAFRIEYWALEEAKLQRMPPEQEFSRKIVLVAGGGSGIGRAVALKLARRGAQIIIADRDEKGAETVTEEVSKISSAEMTMAVSLDITPRESIAKALRRSGAAFRRPDVVVNTAAIFPVADSEGKLSEMPGVRPSNQHHRKLSAR